MGGRGGGEKGFGNFSKRKTDLGQGGLHTGITSTHHGQQHKHMVSNTSTWSATQASWSATQAHGQQHKHMVAH